MAETPPETPESPPGRDWRAGLGSASADERLETLRALAADGAALVAHVAEVERMALHDRSKAVRAAALKLLRAPEVRRWRLAQSPVSSAWRGALLTLISKWRDETLISAEQAEVLNLRYDLQPPASPAARPAPIAAPAPAAAREPTPKRSLGEVLTSEGAIKTALYLGAFFILMAAVIFSALFLFLRVPILLGAAALFLGGSLALKRRLGQASFVLFILYSLLVPLVAAALLDALPLLFAILDLYWVVVTLFLLVNWALAAWLYSSRFFSLLALVAYFTLPGQVAGWLGLNTLLRLNLSALANLPLPALVYFWRRSGRPPSSRPAWAVAHIWQGLVLLGGFFASLEWFDGPQAWLWAAASLWLLAAGFYLLTGGLLRSEIATYAGVLVSLLIPLYIAAALRLTPAWWLGWMAVWGLGYLVTAEVGRRLPPEFAQRLSGALALGGGLLTWLMLLVSAGVEGLAAFAPQAAALVVLAALMVIRPRSLVWVGALFAGLLVYVRVLVDLLNMNAAEQGGLLLLGAASLYWALDVALRRFRPDQRVWWLWPGVFGVAMAGLSWLAFLIDLINRPGQAALGFGLLAVLALVYGIAIRFPWGAVAVAGSLALGWLGLVLDWELAGWLLPSFGLPVGFLLAWGLLAWSRRAAGWARPALVSGLGLLSGLALAAGLENGLRSALVGALGALALAAVVEWLAGRAAREASLPPGGLRAWLAGFTLWATLITALIGIERPFWALAGALALAGLALQLALRLKWTDGLLLACAALAAALHYGLDGLGLAVKTLPMMLLATGYWAAGLATALNREAAWGSRLRAAGLVLAGAAAFVSLPLDGWQPILALAAAAVIVTLEAYRRRSVLAAIPADLLYLAAYFKLLAAFQVVEPQFYSVGAALLGLLMHYLLTRSEGGALAFIAGMLSQLALLGTTYFQMLDSGRLVFFFILFFQALAVIAYGLVARSRSLVFTPIAIVVLAVLTVVFSSLSGLLALAMIGCTGFVLLALGILALVLRDRLAAAGRQVRERMSDWSA